MKKVAIVTGANRGIGLALVRLLCKQFNGDVFLTCRMSNKGKEAIQMLQREGLNPKFHEVDISQPDSIRMFEEFIREYYGGIDILINNAGVSFQGDTKVPIFRQAELCYEVDFMGTLNMCKVFLPLLRPHSRIVNLTNGYVGLKSSLGEQAQKKLDVSTMSLADLWLIMDYYVKAAKVGNHANSGLPESPYQMAKTAITAMTKILARDIKDDPRKNILINACCPGWTKSGGSDDFRGKNGFCKDEDLLTAEIAASDVLWTAMIKPGDKTPNGEVVRKREVLNCGF